ncbi:hypothetical protein DYI95_008200 [Thermaerobacter sp. PB12/4term]|uniref:hypothetical protein n=1 Tax=Thermaerobacter sp. PB12/4term TaxID=2293838 RepID=UPI000E32C1DE|nr:hypothetical protein [Thermaerobacter sp. PB12/4term]QIA27504.1 hypothetical protein DYI95_008200 [Thermaerobacter sp. PB12/4term]
MTVGETAASQDPSAPPERIDALSLWLVMQRLDDFKRDQERLYGQVDLLHRGLTDVRREIGDVRHEMTAIRQEVAGLRQDMHQEIAAVRRELGQKTATVRQELREEFAGLRQEVHREITTVRQELRDAIAGLRQDLRDEIAGLRQEMRNEMATVRHDAGGLQLAMAELRRDLDQRISRLTGWLVGGLVTLLGTVVGLRFLG